MWLVTERYEIQLLQYKSCNLQPFDIKKKDFQSMTCFDSPDATHLEKIYEIWGSVGKKVYNV